jgi:hypothetical protein
LERGAHISQVQQWQRTGRVLVGVRQKAEWVWGVLAELEAAGLVTLADEGYQEARTRRSLPGKEQTRIAEEANCVHAGLRSPGKRANAQAQDFADPPYALLLPLSRRSARQGHPRIADPRGISRMERVHGHLIGMLVE